MSIKSLGFRESLFWDVNQERLDADKNAQFIIGRVLDFGDLDEFRIIERLYGKNKITKATKGHIFSDPRSLNFWSLILSIPKNQLKCTRNPSLEIPNAFLTH